MSSTNPAPLCSLLAVEQPETLSTSSDDTASRGETTIPPIDPNLITELEDQARQGSKSVERMMKYLGGELSKVTQVTGETVGTYDGAVRLMHGEVEANIRSMYALIAKCEELDAKMEPVTDLARQVKSINESLDELEQLCK